MLFACILTNILAIALPSLRISPLLLIRIATIALLYAAALSFNVVYIQSIGSGIVIFIGLFHMTLISQSIIGPLLLSSILPMKPIKTTRSLTQEERKKMTLSPELKKILPQGIFALPSQSTDSLGVLRA